MIISTATLRGFTLHASDGELGRCKDFLFDDESWAVRYMVADTRKWLPGRKVLISPEQLGSPDWSSQTLPVSLTKRRIQDAPPLDEAAPVSRRAEARWADYFGYSRYWAAPASWGTVGVGTALPLTTPPTVEPSALADELSEDDLDAVHIRSCHELVGYALQTQNGELGHVDDVLVDSDTWRLYRWVVKSRHLADRAPVLVPVESTQDISWHARSVHVSLSMDQVAACPRLDERSGHQLMG